MHLRDRGGRHGRAELGEELVDRSVKRLLDRLARLGLREGRQAVLKCREVAGKLAPDDVVAGGEELAELDVGGAERGERLRESRLVARLARPVLAKGCSHAAEQRQGRGQAHIVGEHARAAPGDDDARPREPRHIRDGIHALASPYAPPPPLWGRAGRGISGRFRVCDSPPSVRAMRERAPPQGGSENRTWSLPRYIIVANQSGLPRSPR